jgi:hypothetical protein
MCAKPKSNSGSLQSHLSYTLVGTWCVWRLRHSFIHMRTASNSQNNTPAGCTSVVRILFAALILLVFICELGRTDPIRFADRTFELPIPADMCALSEQRHKEQLEFTRQLNADANQKLLLLIVPCDRLALYEPNSNAPANTSLLFNTAQWDVLLDSKREPLKASNDPAYTISTIKASFQGVLQALNSARLNGQRYPTAGPELRNVTIIDERADRIFTTFINRFQRPFDKGPIDRYAASGVVVIAPYAFKFSIF